MSFSHSNSTPFCFDKHYPTSDLSLACENSLIAKLDSCILHGDTVISSIASYQLPYWDSLPADLPLKDITSNALLSLVPRSDIENPSWAHLYVDGGSSPPAVLVLVFR